MWWCVQVQQSRCCQEGAGQPEFTEFRRQGNERRQPITGNHIINHEFAKITPPPTTLPPSLIKWGVTELILTFLQNCWEMKKRLPLHCFSKSAADLSDGQKLLAVNNRDVTCLTGQKGQKHLANDTVDVV